MEKKSIKKNYIYNMSYQLLSLITPLVTTPYVSRILGAEEIGKSSYTASIVFYFTLFAGLGTAIYGQREIAYHQDDRHKRTIAFWNTEIVSITSTAIVGILYTIFILLEKNYRMFYLIRYINIVTVAVDIVWFFQGLEEFGKVARRNIVFKILNIVYLFAFVKDRSDIYVYVFGLSFFSFLSALSMWFMLKKNLDKVDLRELSPYRNIGVIISFFVPTVATSVYTVLDKSMIGWISNIPTENGLYEQSSTIVKFVLTFVTSLGMVMVPRIGYLYKSGKQEDVRNYMYRSYRFVWFAGIPMCMGLMGVAPNFIPWFLGEEFLNAIELIEILSFLIIAIGINNVTGVQYMIPTNKQNLFTLTVVAGAVINAVLNFILIGRYLAVGAAVASIIAESFIAVFQIFLVRKEVNPIKVINSVPHYLIAGSIMYIAVKGVGSYLKASFMSTCLLVGVGVAVYLLILMIEKDDFLITTVKTILNKILSPKVRK